MRHLLNNFRASESGAVTVDWVVLTAAIVGLGIGCIGILAGGTSNAGDTLKDELLAITIK